MRDRHRYEETPPVSRTLFFTGEQPFSLSLPGPMSFREDMLDTVGNPRGINAVSHTKTRVQHHAISRGGTCNTRPEYSMTENADAGYWSNHPSIAQYDSTVICDVDWKTAEQRLLDDACGVIPADMSLAVNIAEFAELKSLAKSAIGLIPRVADLLSTGRSVKAILKEASSDHLAYNFAIKPLIADIKAIAGLVGKLNQRVREYERRNNEAYVVLKYYAPYSLEIRDIAPVPITSSYGTSYQNGLWEKVTDYKVVAGLQCRCWSRTVGETPALYVRSLVNQLGLNNPLLIAWNLVPFSFVVDWIYNISSKLEAIEAFRDTVRLTGEVALSKVSHFQKVRKHSMWYLTRDESGYMDYIRASGPYLAKEVTTESYVRAPGFPGSSAVVPSGFTFSHTALSASLVLQRIRK